MYVSSKLVIVSWNINSIKVRRMHLEYLLETIKPDIVLLQEIKCIYFPSFDDYTSYIYGQKSYNGVAILVHKSFKITSYNIIHLWQRDDARCIQVNINNISIISIYVPCGWPRTTTSIDIEHHNKTSFLENLYKFLCTQRLSQRDIIIGGDFNIALHDNDVEYPIRNQSHILCNQEIRLIMQKILNLGFYNEFIGNIKYSWKSYQERKGYIGDGSFKIDYIFSTIYGRQEIIDDALLNNHPSDHSPVILYI